MMDALPFHGCNCVLQPHPVFLPASLPTHTITLGIFASLL